MTTKARADVHINLPSLQKLDLMLIVGFVVVVVVSGLTVMCC